MKKIKIAIPENFKKVFTVAQIEAIKALPNEFDDGNILPDDIINIGLGHPEEIYKIEAEYCINKNSCFDENIDVHINALYRKDFFTIIEKSITLSQIYQIAGDADNYGLILRTFKTN